MPVAAPAVANAIHAITAYSALRSFEMDKAAEVELLRAMVSMVPRGTYLSDYLQGAVEDFENMVRLDLCFPVVDRIRQLYQEKVEAEARLKEVQEKVKQAQSTLNKVEWTIKNGRDELASIQEAASTISHRVMQALK